MDKDFEEAIQQLDASKSDSVSKDQVKHMLSGKIQLLESLQKQVEERDYEDMESKIAQHIKYLNQYNELRDTASKLMAVIADDRGVDIGTVAKEYGAE